MSVRFSDDVSYDDESSSSLDAKYAGWDDDDGRSGVKIVRKKGLSGDELREGPWFEACIKEYLVRESEAAVGKKRWALFGVKIKCS